MFPLLILRNEKRKYSNMILKHQLYTGYRHNRTPKSSSLYSISSSIRTTSYSRRRRMRDEQNIGCFQHQQITISSSQQKRYLITNSIEPSYDSNIPERPCTIILAEDPLSLIIRSLSSTSSSSLSSSSWNDYMYQTISKQYGISYSYWNMSSHITTFDEVIQELKNDFTNNHININDIVFIARGPFISYMIQYYLQDLPLNGIILIDPIQYDQCHHTIIKLYEQLLLKADLLSSQLEGDESSSLRLQQQILLFHNYMEHYDHYLFQLEPGSIPLMILQSNDYCIKDDGTNNGSMKELSLSLLQIPWNEMAIQTSKRHSDNNKEYSNFGIVPITSIIQQQEQNNNNHHDDVVHVEKKIIDWVFERVL